MSEPGHDGEWHTQGRGEQLPAVPGTWKKDVTMATTPPGDDTAKFRTVR
jgi:hypothetical protein